MVRSGNPALKESTFLDLGSGSVVSRDGEAMTLNGTVNKTGILLLLAVLTGAFAWSQVEVTAEVAAVGVVSASCEQAVRLTPTAMAATAANDLVRFVVMTRS